MINELHVSLITQLKGVQRDGGRAGRETKCLRAPVASLCLSRRAADDLRVPDVKQTRQKICNPSDRVKKLRSFQLPGNNHIQSRIPFCHSWKALAVIMWVECSQRGQVEPISEPGSHFSVKQLRLFVSSVWTLPRFHGDESKNPVAGRLWWNESVLSSALISQILRWNPNSVNNGALCQNDDDNCSK